MFPWLLTVVVGLFVAEHWLSNRFHGGSPAAGPIADRSR